MVRHSAAWTPRTFPARAIPAAVAALFFGVLSAAAEDAFVTTCPLPSPLDEIKKHHTIDTTCGPEGTGTSDAQKAQNVAKNNL